MTQNKKNLEVTKDVQWIGILDFDITTFDIVMETKYGTTYNSYFINAEKKTLVETAKVKFWDDYLAKIKAVCDPSEIAYIVADHTEPDHSGSIVKLLALAPNAQVVGSGQAIRYLQDIIGHDFPHLIVKDGDTLSLGNKTLRFIGAPNLHWPDSIYTYLEEDKILFTCDSFGAHYCDEKMFEDLCDNYDDAFKYYFDVILRPFSKFMLKAIEKIRPLEIQIIAPGHGPILRQNWKRYVDLSEKWSQDYITLPQANRVLIAYVSAYGYTGDLAAGMAEGLQSAGDILVDLCDIEKMPIEEVAQKIELANAYLIGSPTINQNTLLQIYQVFALMNPIRDRGKLASAFGSFGWSGEAQKILETNIDNMKLKFFGESFFHHFKPNEKCLQEAFDFGKKFGEVFLQGNNKS